MMRFAWVVALGMGACAAPRLESDQTRLAAHPSSTSPDATNLGSKADTEKTANPSSAPVWMEVAPTSVATDQAPAIGAPLLPPDGAACFLRGTGDPFANGCPRSISVSSDKSGSRDLGRFDARRVDITWAFFKGKGRAWVGVRSAGLTLAGFVDARDEHFRLSRQATVVENHVWFHDGAKVRVKAGSEHGVDLAVDDDMAGVERLVSHETCDALTFDIEPAGSRRTGPTPRPPPGARLEFPVRGVLPLRIEPEGRVITTLSDGDGTLALSLEVTQILGDYKRVAFDTKSAHFEVWVKSRDIDGQRGFGSSGIGFGTCGGGPRDGSADGLLRVIADVPVTVGRAPLVNGPLGVTIDHSVGVRVDKRENGFARIVQPFGAISPPAGSFFWVPESALETTALTDAQ